MMLGSSWTVVKASVEYLNLRLPEWTGGDWSGGSVAMAIPILKLGWDVVDTDELLS
jgi:hypothetical protein